MKTRLSRPPTPPATPANHTLRNFLLGFFGFSLLAACLLLVVGGALLLTRVPPVADQLPLGTAPMLVNLTQPFHNRPVSLTDYNTVHADAIGSNPVLVLQLWVDGVPVDAHNVTAEEAFYSSEFSWQPTAPGEHLLVVRALDSAGQLANSNLVRVQANPAQPRLVNILAEEGDSLQSLADAFDLTPEQVMALNPQITTAADQPLPPGTELTLPPASTGPSLGDAEPPIPPDTSLLPVLPDPPIGDVPPAPELDKDNPISIFWDLNITPLWSNTVAPGAPELAVKVNGCDVKLFVFDKAANETGFVVYRASPNDGGFELIAALAANDGQTVMSFTDTGRYGKSLYYVSAFNAAGESPSNFVGTTINSLACLQLDQKRKVSSILRQLVR